MARVTAQEFQEKQARRLKASLPDMKRGIERVTVAPGKKAAAKEDKMKAGIIESIESGHWAARVASVSLEEWQSKMINKGLGRVAQGIDQAKDKTIAFAEQLLPHIDKVVAEVEKLPDLTIDDSIARVTTFMRGMSKFKRH